MLNKGIQKIINSFLSALLALTCFNVYTVTADDDTTTVSETPIETEVKDLNEVDTEETVDTLEESEIQTVADETENNVEESTETEETTVESSPVETADAIETIEPQQEENTIEAEETQESQQVEIVDEESSEQALDLNALTTDELFAYIMSVDTDQMDALYDEYDNLDDLMNQFSEEQKAQLAEKFGNSEEDIETLKTTTYYGKFSPTIEHATVAFCTWKGNSEVLDPTLTVVDGTVNISDYATNKATGYIVFFVKPETNYMITGLNASGNGDYYSLDSTSFGNIGGWFAKQTALIEKAKSEGYIGVFGYSSSNSNKEASFEVIGQQPSLNVSAVSNKTANVVPGDTLTFTVAITPNKTASGKDTITNVKVTEVKINGNTVTISGLKEVNGSYVGTVDYTVSETDCFKKKVELEVEAETSYECKTGINTGDTTTTTAVITKTATADCYIAAKNKVEYEFISGTEGKTLDSSIYEYLPSDANDYFNTQFVSAKELTTKEVKVNDGTWSFKGWDADLKEMTAEGITFTGTWTFEENNKYTVTYVVEGDTPATYNGEIPVAQEYYEGASVTVADILTTSEEHLSDGTRGTWAFNWDKTGSFELAEDTIIRGAWTFTANENASEAGYYLVLDKATWSNGQPEGTYKTEGKNKYFYTNKFASGDSFNVTDKIPTAEGYAFIGWFDKERDGQNAHIREVGDEITVKYNSKDTYCLDALWATVIATGYTGTYDGQEHTIADEISFESGKNWDVKYGDQAKKLITVNSTQYKIGENGEWQTTKPTFKDPGTYTVYVIKSVTVGEKTYQLETFAKVVINKATLKVTTYSASKPYDGKALTAEGEVTGLVNNETVTLTTNGSQTEVGSSTNTYELVWGTANKDNYTVEEDLGTLEVSTKSIEDKSFTVSTPSDVTYNGKSQEQSPVIKDGDKVLVEGTDYDLSYSEDTTNAGKVTVTVIGKGNYEGEVNVQYNIKKATLKVTTYSASKPYDGKALTAEGEVTGLVNNETATLTTNGSQTEVGSTTNTYELVWGTANKDNYTVEEDLGTLEVSTKSIEDKSFTVSTPSDVTYNGKSQEQSPVIKDGDKVLVEGTDYDLSYSEDTTNAGKVTVTVIGKGNYEGEVNVQYNIKKATLKVTTYSASKPYDGKALTAEGEVTGLVNNETATLTTNGSQTEVGSTTNTYELVWGTANKDNYTVEEDLGTLEVSTKSIEDKSFTVSTPSDVTYNGKSQEQSPVIKDGDKVLVEGTDYDLSYSEDTTNAGKVTVTVIGKGNYEGEVNVQYNIKKATLKVTTYSASKPYDGKALTAEGEVTGLVNNETATLTTNGSQTEVGSTTNTYELVWGTANKDNYTVEEDLGTLEVSTKSIEDKSFTVSTPSDVTYNGKSQEQSPVIKDGDKVLVEGTDYDLSYSEDTTNAGKVTVTVIGKGNYEGEVNVQYNIKKATLKVTTYSASKPYDGKALTAEGEVTGLVNNETATLTTNGSQTEVGSTTNTYELVWGTANKDNYTVEEEIGTLTVTETKEVNPTPAPVPDNGNNDSGNNNGGSESNVVPAPVNPTPAPTPNAEPSKSDVTPSEVVPEEDDAVQPSADTETINDDDITPENAGKKKSWALINLICAVASMLLGIFLLFSKKEKEEQDDSNPDNVQMTSNEGEETNSQVRHSRWKVVAVIDAIISVVLFILTENITLPMVLVDKWTLLMFALTCVNVVSLILGRRFHDEDQEEEQA